MWPWLLISAASLVVFLINRLFSYWKRRNVPGPGFIEFLKGFMQVVLKRRSYQETIDDVYRKYSNYPFVGVYMGGTPVLLVKDPDLIKHITTTNFKSFEDNGFPINVEIDPLFGRNPFFQSGEQWKTTRSRLTPGFTSGKMKYIYPEIEKVTQDFVHFLTKNSKGMNSKAISTRFTLDSVASSAFGLEGGSFESDNSEFMKLANGFLGVTDSTINAVFVSVGAMMPWLTKIFSNTKIIPKHIEDKLIEITTSTSEYRKSNNVIRNDFLQYLIQLKENHPDFTAIDVAAGGASFFVDGYETSSIVLSYVLYELAANPDAQHKLKYEIEDTLKRFDGKLTYECLQEMKYLEACILESLRLNTALPMMRKICTRRFKYTTESDDFKKMSVDIEPGTMIVIPVQSLHTDEKYFPDPLSFQPERMLTKDEYNKFVYMPFGAGPRMCLGKRFGMLQVELAVAQLVRNFKISINKKTVLPVVPDPWYFLTIPKDPVYLDFEKI